MTERQNVQASSELLDPTYFTWAVLGYGHPDDVLADAELTSDEKRMILASWLSDRRAVENEPGLRQIDSGAVVAVDEIMDALRRLDGNFKQPNFSGLPKFARRRPRLRSQFYRSSRPDDDDDPPPCAASAKPPHHPYDDPDAASIMIPSAIAA